MSNSHRSTFIDNKLPTEDVESVHKSKKEKDEEAYGVDENQSMSATTSSGISISSFAN